MAKPTRRNWELNRVCRLVKVFLLITITVATLTLVYLGNTSCFRYVTVCSVDVQEQTAERSDSVAFSPNRYGTDRPLVNISHRSNNTVTASASQRNSNNGKTAADHTKGDTGDIKDSALRHEYNADSGNCTKRLPDVLIIGVQKCGTTALAKFLGTHPQVSLRTQQSYFFTSNYFRGLDWYRHFLPCSTNRHLVVERTPQYFYSNRAPRRINRLNKHMKLILIVCEPVRRLLSNVAMAKHRHRESESHDVDDVIFIRSSDNENVIDTSNRYVMKSLYHLYIKQWLHEFSFNNILILDGDIFAKHPLTGLQNVEVFLGIRSYFNAHSFIINEETGFHCISTQGLGALDCLPRTKGHQYRYSDTGNVTLLKHFFSDKNAAFYKLINRTFDW